MKRSTIVALGLMLLILVALIAILQFRNAWVASQLAGFVSNNLLVDAGYEMNLEGIRWRPSEGVELRGLRVRYVGGQREDFDFFEAERLGTQFGLRSLLKGGFRSSSTYVEGAVLRVFPIPTAGWDYPSLDDDGEKRNEAQVDLRHLRLQDFLLLRPSGEGLDSLHLQIAELSLLRDASGTAVRIDSLSGRHPSGLKILGLEGSVFLAGGVLELDSLQLRLPGSTVLVSGRLLLDEGPGLDLSVRADSLDLDETVMLLGRVLDTDSRLSGAIDLTGTPDSLLLSGNVSGATYGYHVEDMDLAGIISSDGRLDFRRAEGIVNGNFARGEARFDLPLDGRPLNLRIQGEVAHLDLERFLGVGPPSDLSGTGLIWGPENDLSFSLDLSSGRFLDLPFGHCQAEIGLQGDSLILHRVQVGDRGLDLTLDGWVLPEAGRLDIRGRGASHSSELARQFTGDPEMQGDLDFSLRIHGSLEGPAMELSGDFRDALFLEAHIDSGRVELSTPALELEPMDMILEVGDVTYWKLDFSSGFLRGRVWPDSLEIAYAHLKGDPLGLTLAGGIPLLVEEPRARFNRFWLHYMDEDWLNDRPLILHIGEHVAVEPVELLSGSGRLSLEWMHPVGGSSHLEWESLDLDMLRRWLPDVLSARGLSHGKLHLDEDGNLDLHLDLEDLLLREADGRLSLDASWRGDSLRLAALDWRLPGRGELAASGGLAGLPPPMEVLEGRPIERDSLRLDLSMDFNRFPLTRIVEFVADSLDLGGLLSGQVHLSGPLDRVLLDSVAELDSFRLERFSLRRLRWQASSDGSNLHLHRIEAKAGRQEESALEGWISFPLELSLLDGVRQDAEGPLSGEFDLNTKVQAFMPALSQWLAVAEGDLQARVAVEGTVANPMPRGRFDLKNARVRPLGWEEEFVDMSARGRVEGDTLFLEDLAAREGLRFGKNRSGTVSAAGWLTWRGPFRYRAEASVANFELSTLPFFSGTLSGDLALSTFLEPNVHEHPFLEGSFKVSRGELHDLIQQSEAAAVEENSPLSYRLDLSSDGGLYLRDQEADLELAGDITMSSLPSGQDISGVLDIRRGRYTLFWHVFHLKEGTLDFNGSKGFNPDLFIEAETRTRDDVITLNITGTLEEPQVGVESSLGYNEEDVLRILIGAPQGGQGWSESTGEVVGGTVSNQLVGRLETWASGEIFSGIFDSVEIQGGNPLVGEEARWQVGRYLPGGFYVTYNHGLSLDSTWELGMENRLLDWMILRMELINRGEELGVGTLPNEYNFDIRFRYEY